MSIGELVGGYYPRGDVTPLKREQFAATQSGSLPPAGPSVDKGPGTDGTGNPAANTTRQQARVREHLCRDAEISVDKKILITRHK